MIDRPKLEELLANLNRYRQVLDDEAVYDYLQDGLRDFDVFAAHVGRWVQRHR